MEENNNRLFQGIIPAFTQEGLRKIMKTLRTVSILAETQTGYLANTGLAHYRYTNELDYFNLTLVTFTVQELSPNGCVETSVVYTNIRLRPRPRHQLH
jgi:hypothetical protein